MSYLCIHLLFYAVQCTNQGKIPISSASVVEKIVHPNCTYGFVINVTMEYDPIVLEDLSLLTVFVRDPSNSLDIQARQGFHSPYSTVSACICTYTVTTLNKYSSICMYVVETI